MTVLAQTPAEATESLIEHGIAGSVILILFSLLVFLLKEHRNERREWRKESTDRSRKQDDNLTVSNAVQKELSSALGELTISAKESAELTRKIREDQIRGQSVKGS